MKQKPFHILEGPEVLHMFGFRHYTIINPNLPANDRRRTIQTISTPTGAAITATSLNARVWPVGTWEHPTEANGMSVESAREIFGTDQVEMAL